MILGWGVGRSHDEISVDAWWECDRGVGVGVDDQIATDRVEAIVTAEGAYRYGKLHQRFYESDEALENYRLAIEIYRRDRISNRLI